MKGINSKKMKRKNGCGSAWAKSRPPVHTLPSPPLHLSPPLFPLLFTCLIHLAEWCVEAHVASARRREKTGRSNFTDEEGTKGSSGNDIVRHLNIDASITSSARLGTAVKDDENKQGFNIGGNMCTHTHFPVAEITLVDLNLTGWSSQTWCHFAKFL